MRSTSTVVFRRMVEARACRNSARLSARFHQLEKRGSSRTCVAPMRRQNSAQFSSTRMTKSTRPSMVLKPVSGGHKCDRAKLIGSSGSLREAM
jgi:hypothetical protein